MNILVIDGNSIVNRAFYGIKMLTSKNGQFTNAIYGFLNILLKLESQCEPEAVAIAFDLKAPTFRHKIYDAYKAGRHGMPDELRSQMPILKDLLVKLGYTIVEKEGFEADDILGTISAHCGDKNHCYIATGDRDSLQLVRKNTTVLLAATKMGQAVTTAYDEAKLLEEYGLSPAGMLQLKALMGDSSDNIPGVPGIGQKGATDLVTRFGTLDYIYDHIDEIDIKKGVRQKLIDGKESAYLSLKLGEIYKDVPIDLNIEDYIKKTPDSKAAIKLFASLDMFGMIEKFGLSSEKSVVEEASEEAQKPFALSEERDLFGLLGRLNNAGNAYFTTVYSGADVKAFVFLDEESAGAKFVSSSHYDFPAFVKGFLESDIEKYTADVKPLYKYALKSGIEMKKLRLDTTLCAYILNPSSNDYSIPRLAAEYSVPSVKIYGDDGLDDELKAASAGCAVLKGIAEFQLSSIADNGQEYLLNEIELPLAKVLAAMENAGMKADRDSIESYGKELEKEIEAIQLSIFDTVGFEFNLNSPKQLGVALFEKLNLPAKKKTKTGYSTNAEVLEELSYDFPVVKDILRYRTLSKLKGTYCDGLIKVIGSDGRIRSTLNQTETRTGRISSLDPNLQNIPVKTPEGAKIRKFFIAPEGKTLVDADYSQIELRVLAHLSGDKNMIKAFNDGVDIHAVTASQVFNMPLDMVTPLMRSRAKAVNFGIVYGIGAFSLSKDIGVSIREADSYIKGYLHHYSGIDAYMKTTVETATENGFAETIFGRRRYLPELSASNKITRSFGERVARNMPIQGSAADIIKLAMIKVFDRLSAEYPDAKLIMQVHDELIIECDESEAEKIGAILKEEMESAVSLSVALIADVHSGKTWYEAK